MLAAGLLLPSHSRPWPNLFQQVWTAAWAAGLILITLKNKTQGRSLPLPRTVWPLAALALVPVLQKIGGLIHFHMDALLCSLYIATLALSIWAGYLVRQSHSAAVADMLGGILGVAALSVCLQMFQWLGIEWLGLYLKDFLWGPAGDRPFANVGQPNQLAALLCLGLLAVGYLYESCRLGGVGAGLLFAWLVFGLVMTRSRGAWLMFLVTAPMWFLARRDRVSRGAVWGGVAGFVVLVVASWIWPVINEAIKLDVVQTYAERLGANARQMNWSALAGAVTARPAFGWGWNQIGEAQQFVASQGAPGIEVLASSHNLLLDLLLTSGLPVGLLTIGGMVTWLVSRGSKSLPLDALAALCGALVIVTYAMTEFPQEFLYFLIPLGLMVGVVEASVCCAAQVVHRAWLGACTLLLVTFGAWVVWEYVQVEEADRDARMALAHIGAHAGQVVPVPDVWLLDGLQAYHRFRFDIARAGMSQDELDAARRVVLRYPFPPALFRLAMMQGLNGQPAAAVATLRGLCNTGYTVNCRDAAASWAMAQQRYPALQGIRMPAASHDFDLPVARYAR